jgi:hypothetical protein
VSSTNISAALAQALERFGIGLADEPEQLRAVLSDLAPPTSNDDRRRLKLVVDVAQVGVAGELARGALSPTEAERRLADRSGVDRANASWSVRVWCDALGLQSDRELPPEPGPSRRRGWSGRVVVAVIAGSLLVIGGGSALVARSGDRSDERGAVEAGSEEQSVGSRPEVGTSQASGSTTTATQPSPSSAAADPGISDVLEGHVSAGSACPNGSLPARPGGEASGPLVPLHDEDLCPDVVVRVGTPVTFWNNDAYREIVEVSRASGGQVAGSDPMEPGSYWSYTLPGVGEYRWTAANNPAGGSITVVPAG